MTTLACTYLQWSRIQKFRHHPHCQPSGMQLLDGLDLQIQNQAMLEARHPELMAIPLSMMSQNLRSTGLRWDPSRSERVMLRQIHSRSRSRVRGKIYIIGWSIEWLRLRELLRKLG